MYTHPPSRCTPHSPRRGAPDRRTLPRQRDFIPLWQRIYAEGAVRIVIRLLEIAPIRLVDREDVLHSVAVGSQRPSSEAQFKVAIGGGGRRGQCARLDDDAAAARLRLRDNIRQHAARIVGDEGAGRLQIGTAIAGEVVAQAHLTERDGRVALVADDDAGMQHRRDGRAVIGGIQGAPIVVYTVRAGKKI